MVAELTRKFEKRLTVAERKRGSAGSDDEDMIELEAFGAVCGHEVDSILVARGHGDCAAGFFEVFEIFEQLSGFSGLGDRLLFPAFDETEHGMNHR